MLLSHPTPSLALDYELEVIKSKRLLRVKRGNRVERAYFVAVGSGGPGKKQRRGDRTTPVGRYRIVDFNEDSHFHLFMQLSYPNLRDAFGAQKHHMISRRDYADIQSAHRLGRIPPQNTRLGGMIGIHGIGQTTDERLDIHRHINWTQGCIALTNTEIDDLRRYVHIGTTVIIRD